MKSLRLLAVVLLACSCSASLASACDNQKSASNTKAASASATKVASTTPSVPAEGGCSAEAITYKTAANGASGCSAGMAAQCTPAMRAACEKNAAVAAAMGCSMKGATRATTASLASNGKSSGCALHGASATTASTAAGCPGHAMTAANMDHCAAHASTVSALAAGMRCADHLNGVAHDCSACEQWANIEQDARSLGAKAQLVSLKNGAMIVYTADSPSGVKALQSMVAKRNDKMTAALAAGSDKKLCEECKQLRGAIASGILHREVVNVERGCMTLITSNDHEVLQKIRAMTGQPVAMR